jgi:hypothetical protein
VTTKWLRLSAACVLAVLITTATPVSGEDRDWRIVDRTQGSGPDARREIEMRPKYDLSPGSRLGGTVGSTGYTVLHDLNGNSLRGFVQPDGTAVLRDPDGNYHRFNTRQQP